MIKRLKKLRLSKPIDNQQQLAVEKMQRDFYRLQKELQLQSMEQARLEQLSEAERAALFRNTDLSEKERDRYRTALEKQREAEEKRARGLVDVHILAETMVPSIETAVPTRSRTELVTVQLLAGSTLHEVKDELLRLCPPMSGTPFHFVDTAAAPVDDSLLQESERAQGFPLQQAIHPLQLLRHRVKDLPNQSAVIRAGAYEQQEELERQREELKNEREAAALEERRRQHVHQSGGNTSSDTSNSKRLHSMTDEEVAAEFRRRLNETSPWREATDQSTGQVYFFRQDTQQTQWTEPREHQLAKQRIVEQLKRDRAREIHELRESSAPTVIASNTLARNRAKQQKAAQQRQAPKLKLTLNKPKPTS
ncbi:MAG: hypothetical protein MHM6MM_001753 [Cercozoa sp. M6MM]